MRHTHLDRENMVQIPFLDYLLGGQSFSVPGDIPPLAGKTFLITGANSGLGKQSVLELSRVPSPPSLIWVCARGEARAQATIDEIDKAVPGAAGRLRPLDLDLTSFDSIKAAARRVLAESERLDVLMLNAGIMASPAGATKEGYEIQFGTNHVGHALLVKLLRPILTKTAAQEEDVRVVVLSSAAVALAPWGGIKFESLKSEQRDMSTWTRYGQSKLANILFTVEMSKRFPEFKTIAVHPGVVATNLAAPFASNMMMLSKPALWVFNLFTRRVDDGVRNQLWAAVSPDAKSGMFYFPVGNANYMKGQAKDEELAKKLWEWTEKELEGHEV